jgi:hypothetical protein
MNLPQVFPFAIALSWSGLWINLVVIPFYNVREKWHKDYIDSGALDQVKTFIDSNKLIPNLAELIDLVIVEKKTKIKVPTATLLETVDFLPALEKTELAGREKAQLDNAFDLIHVTARKLWRWGLFHVGATFAVWLVLGILGPESTSATSQPTVPREGIVFWVAIVVGSLFWVISLCFVAVNFFKFDSRRDAFLSCMKQNR